MMGGGCSSPPCTSLGKPRNWVMSLRRLAVHSLPPSSSYQELKKTSKIAWVV